MHASMEEEEDARAMHMDMSAFVADEAAVEAECERWRSVVDLDPKCERKTLEAVQWAVSLLLQIEDQERSGGEELKINVAGDSVSGDQSFQRKEEGPHVAEDEDDAEVEPIGVVKTLQPQEIILGSHMQKELQTIGQKRKSVDVVLGKKAREIERSKQSKTELNIMAVDSLEGAVKEADSGKAGTRMAGCVGAWMVRPQCHNLVNLISHCLIKSADQSSPFEGSLGDMPSERSEGVNGELSSKRGDEVQSTIGCVWLHQWLVHNVMQNASELCEDSKKFDRSPLDWLVAHLAATSPNLIVAIVLDDLVDNLIMCNARSSATLLTYVRRIGILEYVALRVPKQIATGLGSLFLTMKSIEPTKDEEGGIDAKMHYKERRRAIMTMWLVMATLCPQCLGACFQYWMPLLTNELMESYENLFQGIIDEEIPSVPLWSVLEGSTQEEPQSISAWLSAILSRRLLELAPVGTDLVLLLSKLIQVQSSDRDKELAKTAALLLNVLYRDLSLYILPSVIGAEQITGTELLSSITKDEEQSGASLFVDNLKSNMNKLWAQVLNIHSGSICQCYEQAESTSLGLNLLIDTELAGNGTGLSKAQPATNTVDGGCEHADPFLRIIHLTILSCGNYAVAELLADATVSDFANGRIERKSSSSLLLVMEVMRLVAGQGRGAQVYEIWAHLSVTCLAKLNNDQALQKALAIQQLLDPMFWQSHRRVFGTSSRLLQVTSAKQVNVDKGLAWKVVWTLLQKVLDSQWLELVPLLHRKNAWELQLVVLYVLRLLSPDKESRPQAVVVRLKGLLGIFFQWLDELDNKDVEIKTESTRTKQVDKWQSVQALEQLKCVIVQQASSAVATFTLMVSSLLDYSFEHSARKAEASALSDSCRRLRQSGNMQRRGLGAGQGSLSVSTLVAGRLDQFGNFTLLSAPAGQEKNSTAVSKFSLSEEIRRLKSGGLYSLDVYERERLGNGDVTKPLGYSLRDDYGIKAKNDFADTTMMELRDLLRRTLASSVSQAAENPIAWSPPPANVLAMQMIDRLETPHEMAMTMEQYEEVLPKHVSSPRHIFLTDCFGQNQLLLEMLELVVKNRERDEVLRCIEFIRVLLAENISRWQSAYRTRRNPALPPARVSRDEKHDRMQVIWLINLVADAGWLPQPLASTIEIVELIDGADIADLLLLVWRCMHHAMTFGAKCWGGVAASVTPRSGVSEDAQMQGVEDESRKEGTYTEWEGHLFAILRQNIAQIGGHFAQVYPIRHTF